MSLENRNRRSLPTVMSLTVAAVAYTAFQASAQDEGEPNQAQESVQENQAKEQPSEQLPRERQRATVAPQRADDEVPALGIFTGACPGNAVCVKGVLPHSPASEADIEPGDYILSIEGNEVTSPAALQKQIENMKLNAEVTLKIWRQGQEIERKVQLASQADDLPKGHDAWLGVMLTSDEDGAVRIDQIVPGSPAFESQLMEGDTLIKALGKEIKNVQSFIEMIEEMGPGDELQLTVRRDNEEHAIGVKLGSFGDAPMAFLRHLQPDFETPLLKGTQGDSRSYQLIDQSLDDLRRQIRALREEVRELKGHPSAEPADPTGDKVGNASSFPNSIGARFVAQIQSPRAERNDPPDRLQRSGRYRDYDSRDFDRGPDGYYRPYGPRYWQDDGRNFAVPRGGYRTYYRYQGRPYYYGGRRYWNGNRPRADIEVRRNVRVFWY